jgi:signal transduction histidine kinase
VPAKRLSTHHPGEGAGGWAAKASLTDENNRLRIGQDAVNTAIKHSRARSVQMELHYEPAFVRLLVQDDGCGFDPQRPVSAAPDHFGLTAMRERAEKLGGRLFITSSPGEGAIIEAEIPDRLQGTGGKVLREPDGLHTSLESDSRFRGMNEFIQA